MLGESRKRIVKKFLFIKYLKKFECKLYFINLCNNAYEKQSRDFGEFKLFIFLRSKW